MVPEPPPRMQYRCAMDIPHSTAVVTGRRIPFWKRPDWDDREVLVWIAVSPVLILGAAGYLAWVFTHPDDAGIVGFLAALLAIGVGVGVLYTRFIADRSVDAPCPVCATPQRWSPGQQECHACWAYMRVDGNGTLREASLDDTGLFSLIVDDDTFGDAVDKQGHVTVVMPAICAVCGAPPTTSGTVKDRTDLKSDDPVTTTTAGELAALAVPLCGRHANETPVSVDAYIAWLEITSYRYYRAFLIANGLPKKHVAAAAVRPTAPPKTLTGKLEPLVCDSCGAPLAVGGGDETTCAACGHKAPLPEPYRLLRDAKRMSEQDAAQLQAVAADVATPPPAWKRVAMIVGYVVGGATVLAVAIGAIVGAVLGAIVLGIVAIPYAGEIVASMLVLHDSGASADIINSASPAYRYDLIAAAILYGLGVIPIALAYRTQGNLNQIVALQGELAALRSPSAGGTLCCRHCGAALDMPRDAVASRCLYCGTDNLLTVSVTAAASRRDEALHLDASVEEVVAKHARERREDGAITRVLLVVGLLLVPYILLSGYLFHRVFCS